LIKTTRQLSKINPYVGEFEGRRSVPSMGVWGQAPSINLAYYKEFGIAAKMLNNTQIQAGAL
jgi:hypothetical protein